MNSMTSTRTERNKDAETAKELLLWARKESIVVSSLKVGNVELVANDLRLAASLTPSKKDLSDEAAAKNLYAEYGGGILETAEQQAEEAVDAFEDEDD